MVGNTMLIIAGLRHNVSFGYIAVQGKLFKKVPQHTYESRRPQSAFTNKYMDFVVVLGLIFHVVEDFPCGYPRFSRLFVAHPSFAMSRKFLAIRARLLFVKQDHLSMLEERLNEIDHSEPRKMFLGNLRRDKNESRKSILDSMDKALRDYGKILISRRWYF